jgi:hypothetical protein
MKPGYRRIQRRRELILEYLSIPASKRNQGYPRVLEMILFEKSSLYWSGRVPYMGEPFERWSALVSSKDI